jgi:predicted cupin superfamily sugar epimerase
MSALSRPMRSLLESALASPTDDVRTDVVRLRETLTVVLQRSLDLAGAGWEQLVACAADRGRWDHWRSGGLQSAAQPDADAAPEATRDLLADLAEELLARGHVLAEVWEGEHRQAAVESPLWVEGRRRRELVFAIEAAIAHAERRDAVALDSSASTIERGDTAGSFPGLVGALRGCAADLRDRSGLSARSRARLITALAGTPFVASAARLRVSSPRPPSAAEVIAALGLEPLPVEGGLFRQTWRHDENGRALGTATMAALTDDPDSFSAMHKLDRDEIWHFYLGDPVQLLLLHPGGAISSPLLGADLLDGQSPQIVVPAGTWMGATLVPGGEYALFGNTMAPGFESSCYEGGVRDELVAGWPAATEMIDRLIRPGAPTSMPEGL